MLRFNLLVEYNLMRFSKQAALYKTSNDTMYYPKRAIMRIKSETDIGIQNNIRSKLYSRPKPITVSDIRLALAYK